MPRIVRISHKPVTIVGGGWAGLAAAIELARNDIPVTLLEAAKQLGGRARRVQFNDLSKQPDLNQHEHIAHNNISIDNGQHLLVGAYDATLSLLRTIGIKEKQVLQRRDLSLTMLSKDWRPIRLKTGKMPAPLHLAIGLLTMTGVSIKDRLNALKFTYVLTKSDFTIKKDESCLSLFKKHNQSHKIIKALWEPLCLAGLNTHISEASAEVYLHMLRETFAHTRSKSNLLFTMKDLGKLLPDPALDYIERYGGSIRLGNKVTGLQIRDNKTVGVTLSKSSILTDHVILATPYYIAERLMSSHTILAPLCQRLTQLESRPICTIYLQYPKLVKLPGEVVGLLNTTAQWIFDRRVCNQAGLMSIVISGSGDHMSMSNAELCTVVEEELAIHFPTWPKAKQRMVIREKRATFNCHVNINKIRPGNSTAVTGLWIAGDYTDTQLPATLESAIRSGTRSAKAIIDAITHRGK